MWNKEASLKTPGAPDPGAAVSPSAPASPVDERRQVAWVGKSVLFRGDLISSEDMTIDGRIEGSIEVRDHHLSIGPNATITADVVAKMVTIFGKITGSVMADEKIEIRRGATVEAEIQCQSLAIQEGAFFCGKVDMSNRGKTKATPEAAPAAAAAKK
jgi:cytoskeletal protein CcmA (bactofilin family)